MNAKKQGRGIIRNRFNMILEGKKKRHRFQNIGKELQVEQPISQAKSNEEFSSSLLSTAQNSSSSSDIQQQPKANFEYSQAREKLDRVKVLQMKMSALCKTRLQSFKQSETKLLDKSINQMATQAMECIVAAEGNLVAIRNTVSPSANENKLIRNIQSALASEIRQATRQLRSQQKQYFGKLKSYESGSVNSAIQLTPMQKQRMKDELLQDQLYQELNQQRSQEINNLVTSINRLTTIYKQLNQLVIDQGTLVDRIDYNIDETVQHTKKAVVHLQGAQKHASSKAGERCIKILLVMVLVLALVLGFKYSKG